MGNFNDIIKRAIKRSHCMNDKRIMITALNILDLKDIMKVANYVYKDKNSLSGSYLIAADYNLDNSYNIQDIMKMANTLYKGGI